MEGKPCIEPAYVPMPSSNSHQYNQSQNSINNQNIIPNSMISPSYTPPFMNHPTTTSLQHYNNLVNQLPHV